MDIPVKTLVRFMHKNTLCKSPESLRGLPSKLAGVWNAVYRNYCTRLHARAMRGAAVQKATVSVSIRRGTGEGKRDMRRREAA